MKSYVILSRGVSNGGEADVFKIHKDLRLGTAQLHTCFWKWWSFWWQ